MALILLIRHGLTDAVGHQLAGWTPGIHLNHEGRAQVDALASSLAPVPIAAVYSSPLERTAETAREIAVPHGLPVQVRQALGEVRYGDWTGKLLSEVEDDPQWRHWNEHRGKGRCPKGESMVEIQQRMVAELHDIAAQHPAETVAVVSHGDPIRAALGFFLATTLDHVLRLQINPASVSTVEFTPPRIVVHNLNAQVSGIVPRAFD